MRKGQHQQMKTEFQQNPKPRLRPYRHGDGTQIATWIQDEDSHVKWCAGTLPFGFAEKDLEENLRQGEERWGDMGFTMVNETGVPVGFFKLSLNLKTEEGFLKCIIVDGKRRGQGLGKKMLELAAVYGFQVADMQTLCLNVFDDNPGARACYEKVGFQAEAVTEPIVYKGKTWNRTRMVLRRAEEQ